MCAAAQRGDCSEIDDVVQAGAPLADPSFMWGTDRACPLLLAAQNDHADAVTLMLAYGGDPSARTPDFVMAAAMAAAAFHGSFTVLRVLLDAGAGVGEPCLSRAIDADRADVVEFLLQAKVDLEGRPWMYGRPLDRAIAGIVDLARTRDVERVVQVLLNGKANPNPRLPAILSPAAQAVRKGATDVVRILLAAKADADSTDGVPPVMLDLADGRPDMVRALLDAGADARRASLVLAARCTDTLKMLLAAKADVRAVSGDALMRAAEHARTPDAVRVLWDAGVRPSPPYVSRVLHEAVCHRRGAYERVRRVTATVIRHACTQEVLDSSLVTASRYCNTGAAVALLEAGADPGFSSKRCARLLGYACQVDDVDFVTALLKAKAAPPYAALLQTCNTFGSMQVSACLVAAVAGVGLPAPDPCTWPPVRPAPSAPGQQCT
jgi:hypothetical protein